MVYIVVAYSYSCTLDNSNSCCYVESILCMSILQVYFANVFILRSQNDSLMDKLGKIMLRVYKIEEPYGFKSSFSSASLRLLDAETGQFSFSSLFSLQDVGKCPEINWNRQEFYSGERSLFIDVVQNVFSKLGEVTLQPTYKSKVLGDVYTPETDSQSYSQDSQDSHNTLTTEPNSQSLRLPVTNAETGIICNNIGIGDRAVWYGTPDARIRANDSDVLVEWEASKDKSIESVLVEAKFQLKNNSKQIGQVVAAAITHSFTEHYNHEALNSMTPMILLDDNHMVIVLYDCVQDVLIISNKIEYFDENNALMNVGVVVAWLVINHRLGTHSY